MVEKNPFSYGSPVSDPYFAGRTAELAALISRIENGINVVVTAPRRYGKTSLLVQASGFVAETGGAVVTANLLRTPGLDALAGRLATETYHLRSGTSRSAAHMIPEFLKRIRLHPSVTFDDAGRLAFSFAPTVSPADARLLIEDVFKLLGEISSERPVALMLDEFQATAGFALDLPGLLKGLCDQYPGVSLVIAGSQQHLMEALVLSKGAPLYNMAERLVLGPIDEAVMNKFLRSRAKSGGKPMEQDAATRILETSGPIPYDIQRLSYEVFNQATDHIAITDVDRGLASVASHEAENHAERFAALTIRHRRVLVELSRNEVSKPQSGAFAEAAGYANPAGVSKALRSLLDDETVVRRDGVYTIADPFFRAWLQTVQ